MITKKLFFAFLLSFYFINCHSQVVVPDDKDYFVFTQEEFYYIYPEEYRNLVPFTVKANQKIQSNFQKSFAWHLDEDTALILASSYNQIANAFATVIPNIQTVFYNGGGAIVDSFAIRSWPFTLLTHEGSHLYQLDAKVGPSKWYHAVFRNSIMPHIFFVIPIFTSPNFLLPLWILEGNAILNESRFGNGGRLYSGEERALFYALVNSGKLNEERLTNNHLDFPFLYEKYNVGAYFSLYLAEKYGIDKVNSYFKTQAKHYIVPLIVNSTFDDHFGEYYSTLIEDFLRHYKTKAKNQKTISGTPIITSVVQSPMNHDEKKIYFLTSDYKDYPTLNIIDRQTGEHKQQKVDLPIGKLFELSPNQFYSATSGTVDQKRELFSLWGEGDIDLPEYRSQIVLDIRNGKKLWFNAKTSFDQPQLHVNNQFFTQTNSTAILGNQGDIYYFKQDRKKRTLYKNHHALLTFESYYGKIVDIGSQEEVYFITTTEFGASLFMFDGQQTKRILEADTIVDAKTMSENRILVCQVTGDGYQYKIIKANPVNQEPKGYTHFFEKEKEFQIYDQLREDTTSIKVAPEREYGFPRDIRFSGIGTSLIFFDSYFNITLDGLFTDPLNHHQFMLSGNRDEYSGMDTFQFVYLNNVYLLQWFLGYSRIHYYPTKGYDRDKEYDDSPQIGIYWPIFKWSDWYLSFTQSFMYSTLDSEIESYSSLLLKNENRYGLNLYPFRHYSFFLEYLRSDQDDYTSSAYFKWVHDFGSEFVFSFDSLYKETNEYDLVIDSAENNAERPVLSGRYTIYAAHPENKSGGKVGFEFSKVINWSHYFAAFPVSLRRLAPKFLYNHFYYRHTNRGDFGEMGFGMDFEFLFFHLFPATITFARLKPENDSWMTTIVFGYNSNF